MTLIHGRVAALLADLEGATTEIINRHWDADEETSEPILHHFGFFEISVRTQDGLLARFMEEGIDLYPEEK